MAMNYIVRAACHGQRPSAFASLRTYERSALVARLLKERDIARFVVAPDGYGKTSLAVDYAETVFGWNHVFWLAAQSPCFIRDLDAESIASACFDADDQVALVVIDDLPFLDDQRIQRLSQEMEALLARGCEVLVTSVPSCDASRRLRGDCIRLDGTDLLLQDEELDALRGPDERQRVPVSEIPECRRVPALAWDGDGQGAERFARAALREELPSDVLLVMGSVLVLRKGSCEDLHRIVALDQDTWDQLRRDYPHLGISAEGESFEAAPLEIEAIAQALKGRLDAMGQRSFPGGRKELIGFWAERLLEGAMAGRACDVMRLMNSRQNRAAWLDDHAWALIRRGCFFPAFLIARDRRGLGTPMKLRLEVFEALCRATLGDEAGAVKRARRCMADPEASEEASTVAALLLTRFGSEDEAAAALAVLEDRGTGDGFDIRRPASQMAALRCAAYRGVDAVEELWAALSRAGADPAVLGLGASWAFGLMGRSTERPRSLEQPAFPSALERFVRAELLATAADGFDYFIASAGLAMEEAHGRGIAYGEGALDSPILFGLRQVEIGILAQRALFAEEQRQAQAKRSDWARSHPESALGSLKGSHSQAKRHIPVLSLRFFGCFQVAIGDTVIPPSEFRRQNARSLLVLLAVNQGKEVPREALARAMWPESDAEVARKNFYTVWAQLRKSLSLEDGTCPYLVRHQFGCSLEQRYVRSDIARFSEICRELLFGVPEVTQWSSLFAEIDSDFSSELMPSEKHNPLVIQARNEYRSRLVDALVSATATIVDAGHAEWGIWFARSALRHDQTREDAWVALMQAQIACSQRTAAMMTFLKCRRILDEQLGIDPSPEAYALYGTLLEGQVAAAG